MLEPMSESGPGDGERDAPDDAARLAAAAEMLTAAVDRTVPAWIERLVTERLSAWLGTVNAAQAAAAAAAGQAARDEVVPTMRALLETDVDAQPTNPLSVLRQATVHAHRVLADAGVPPVVRDDFAERAFPDDDYGLVPASWDDIDPSLTEPGITWSAAKAFVFKARRRREGLT